MHIPVGDLSLNPRLLEPIQAGAQGLWASWFKAGAQEVAEDRGQAEDSPGGECLLPRLYGPMPSRLGLILTLPRISLSLFRSYDCLLVHRREFQPHNPRSIRNLGHGRCPAVLTFIPTARRPGNARKVLSPLRLRGDRQRLLILHYGNQDAERAGRHARPQAGSALQLSHDKGHRTSELRLWASKCLGQRPLYKFS